MLERETQKSHNGTTDYCSGPMRLLLTLNRQRHLDDEDLDSGDDINRTDRVQQEEQQEEFETREVLSMDMEVARQPVPEPSDGEVRLRCFDTL